MSVVVADSVWGRGWRAALLMLLGICLLTASAKFTVPFYPVPMTLQTLVVLLIGGALGAPRGIAAVGGYLALGALGAPVFAAGGGIAYMVGPTGGFLFGFLPAVALAGFAVQRGWARGFLRMFGVLFVADALIFVCGVSYLSLFLGWDKAVAAGLLPFVLGDLCKVAVAAAALTLLRKNSDSALADR